MQVNCPRCGKKLYPDNDHDSDYGFCIDHGTQFIGTIPQSVKKRKRSKCERCGGEVRGNYAMCTYCAGELRILREPLPDA